jgi:hypothetical protein
MEVSIKNCMTRSDSQGIRIRKSRLKRLELFLLGIRIKAHFRRIDYVVNDWTDQKAGKQQIKPIRELYTDGRYVYTNGVPLYDLKSKKYIA